MTRSALRTTGRAAARVAALALALGPAAGVVRAAADDTPLSATTLEPRAFGYQVGDLVARTIAIHVPRGLILDASSLPQPGARGAALELRDVTRREGAEAGGRRIELSLQYQVFLAPAQSRTLEMPVLTLHFDGQPRAQDLRIEAWPVTVSPLVPTEVSPRRGLGELQPDTPPPLIDTGAGRLRLVAYGVLMLALLGYLAQVYIALPWRARSRRPFALAWRELRGLPAAAPAQQHRAAFKRVHEALNASAGEVVFEHGIDRFVAARPNFAALRSELAAFFAHSRSEFFGQQRGESLGDQRSEPQADRSRWLLEFCRRCRDAERGTA